MTVRLVKALNAEVVEVTRGLWCPACALPSGAVVVIAYSVTGGALRLGRVAKCSDCKTPLPAPADGTSC